MRVLCIGGTGNISASVSRLLRDRGVDLYLLHRGLSPTHIDGVHEIIGDINDEEHIASVLGKAEWDCVIDWIVYHPEEAERDIRLFADTTAQYIFISSASCYQKPPVEHMITEKTPLENPYWEYSRDKIACEERYMRSYRETGFPVTIVRPSHTYDTIVPYPLTHGNDVTLFDRIRTGSPVVVHGDGTSLWTVTHSKDFARGFVGLVGNPQAIGEDFHITSDEWLTWNQIIEITADALGTVANMIHIPSDTICSIYPEYTGTLLGDKAHCALFDNTKIRRFVSGFSAEIPFSEGIRKTIEWFDQHPDRQVHAKEANAVIEDLIQQYRFLL